MSSSAQPAPSGIPPDVATIIEAFAQSIQPAVTFLLIGSIFTSFLIPLLLALFALSTSSTRRKPVFILNVVSVVLGIVFGVISDHLSAEGILNPLHTQSKAETFTSVILYMCISWFPEAVLVLRVVTIYAACYRRTQIAKLLIPPAALKIARVGLIIFMIIQWKKALDIDGLQRYAGGVFIDTWSAEVYWLLEILDNGYISFLFLWRLRNHAQIFGGKDVGGGSGDRDSYVTRLRTLFWLASTNFVFPTMFLICVVALVFSKGTLTAGMVDLANKYISIISSVAATIWASTPSFRENGGFNAECSATIAFHPRSSHTTTTSISSSDANCTNFV